MGLGILLLICIIILYFIPEGMTFQIINYYMKNITRKRPKIHSIILIIISSILNMAIFIFVQYRTNRNWNIRETISNIITFQFTYQSISNFSKSLILCMILASFLGYVIGSILLRINHYEYKKNYSGQREMSLLFLMVSFIGIVILVCHCIQYSGNHRIVINEICSNNEEVSLDEQGSVYDYLEIYNNGNLPYKIEQLYISDSIHNLKKYEISPNILDSRKYLLILLDEEFPFSISDLGETIYLSNQNGTIIDQIECSALSIDTCYCRVSDGDSVWGIRTCTPGTSNNESMPIIQKPIFSTESGFYKDGFHLTISSEENTTVFYTLDGSIPTSNSLIYNKPIYIGDASKSDNVWSKCEDVVIDGHGYWEPDYLIDKCTIIRAICMDKSGNASSINSASYFVGFDEKEGYEGMNFLSIITDPKNLFSKNKGIYVAGDIYDNYHPSENEQWFWWDANYRQVGRLWEREACLQFFNKDGNLILSKDAGIRIQGGVSRANIPRSFNFYARNEYDGSNRFETDFWGNGYEPQRITLFAGGNDRIKLKDYLMSSIISNRNFSTMDFEPFVMFLDGEYWGCYWLTEKYDEEYFEYHYGVDKNNVIMYKYDDNHMLSIGNEEDLYLYDDMREFVINSDLSIEQNYKKANELIDINSVIDYYAAEIYIGRCRDWPNANFALWRTKNIENNKYSDGKWRWILFDVNSSCMTSEFMETDTLAETLEVDPFFASLMRNRDFQKKFWVSILDMANKEFHPQNVDTFIGNFKATMIEPLEKEYMRFHAVESNELQDIENSINDVQLFFHVRYNYIISYYENYCNANA